MKKLMFLFWILCFNTIVFSQGLKSDTDVDQMPTFPTCDIEGMEEERKACTENELLKYMFLNIRYPLVAKENGISGLVTVRFVITTEGKVDSISLVKGIGGGCDEEIIYLVSKMNNVLGNWTPGNKDGKNIPVAYTLPIRFKLAGKGISRNSGAGLPLTRSFKGETVFGEKEVDRVPTIESCKNISNNKKRKKCGQEKLVDYILKNMEYPATAIDKKIEGLVVIKFIVTKTGEMENIQIGKGIGGGCEKEVLEVFKKMISENLVKWDPGTKDGAAVHIRHNLLIELEITKEMKKARKQELQN